MITILDVLENFLASRPHVERDFRRMPGSALFDLGEQVRRFAREYQPAPPDQDGSHPTFLGGWPSANIWDSQNGSLAMVSLLYSGQVLAKDPISDWFSFDQYAIPTKLAARPGFIEIETGRFNTARTRRFLSLVVPELFRLRPLIEKKMIILAPSKRFVRKRLDTLNEIARLITSRVGEDIASFTLRFHPSELPMEDNVRGMFPFSGGDREVQIRKSIEHSARYFAAEHAFATEHGFVYTSPFKYETFLCEQAMEPLLAQATGANVIRAMFNSRLHLFKGLTPEIISKLRDDDNFGAFRGSLFQTYKDIPTKGAQEDLDKYIVDAESAMIEPCLRNIEKEASHGSISKIGVELKQAAVRIGLGILTGAALADKPDYKTILAAVGISALPSFFASLIKKSATGPQIVWKQLYEHGSKIADEVPRTQSVQGQLQSSSVYWGISEKPSMHIYISGGQIIPDYVPENDPSKSLDSFNGSPSEPYGLCPCKSGHKYKFCCKGLEKITLPTTLD